MNEQKSDMPIILLHGLGENITSLRPIEYHLNLLGYNNTHIIHYPADTFTFDQSLDYVTHIIEEILINDELKKIIVIGQSMGGVIANNLWRKNIDIEYGIYICSPLHGASILGEIEGRIPTIIRDYFYKLPYDYLKNKEREEEPPHEYTTISLGWAWTEFDGCVYKSEAIIDPNRNIHLSWADHRTIFADPRLSKLVSELVMKFYR